MKCPYCQGNELKVVDKRNASDLIRRRRECISCEKRFTTYEKIEGIDITVIKKDGRREPFNREKLVKGIAVACEKRPVTSEAIKEVADCIEASIRKRKSTEIKSGAIGEIVVRKLRALDEVAYMRFASVYRSFDNIKAFEQEIKVLKK